MFQASTLLVDDHSIMTW